MLSDDVRVSAEIQDAIETARNRIIDDAIEIIKTSLGKLNFGLGYSLLYHAQDAPLASGTAQLMLVNGSGTILFIVEIVPGEASSEDAGRLLGHVGWLKKVILPDYSPDEPILGRHAWYKPTWYKPGALPNIESVKGILLAYVFNASALSAVSICPDLVAKTFQFSIEIGQP